MRKRRVRQETSDGGFAKPILGLALLGLLYLAFQTGLIDVVSSKIVGQLKPTGPTNAGEIYEREMAKKAGE